METVGSTIKLMSKCCYMSSIDLRDAFYSISIAPEIQKVPQFYLEGGDVPVHCIAYGPLKQPQNFYLGS